MLIAEATSSDDGSYSVIAGEVAQGVSDVVARYPDGSVVTIHPDAAGIFVHVARPATPKPADITARWDGGYVVCTADTTPEPPDLDAWSCGAHERTN
jgi:hypothetical protein